MAGYAKRPPVFVLTGGPCGGKTSVLAHLQWELPQHGVRVITVPEAARTLMESGILPAEVGMEAFQETVTRTQLALEGIFRGVADAAGVPAVVLCDRGVMDNRAYMDEPMFLRLLKRVGMSVPELRDARYDAVVHLVTAANGAEPHYVCDTERKESPAEARALDEATRDAWVGHPHLHVVDNSTGFEEKKQRVLKAVLHHLGMPIPLEIERKYAVPRSALTRLPGHAKRVEIEQYYLETEQGVERVRRRGQDGQYVYYRTIKAPVRPGVNIEHEWQITEEEYVHERDARGIAYVRKHRWCFVHEHQYFEFDDFSPMELDLCLLEVELTEEQAVPLLPPWIAPCRDVTDDRSFSNRALARPV